MVKRIHNFNAGPAALPLPVLEQVQKELLDFQGSGMSIMEMSHRSKVYDAVHNETIANIKKLLGIGDEYSIIFMGGGARSQFALAPMNLRGKDGFAQYAITGNWAEGAFKEGKKLGDAREIFSSAASKHDHVPEEGTIKVDPNAAFFHYTSNNTVEGTQWHYVPDTGSVPLVCDMSSDFLSRPFAANRFGLIYAGAQKNIGPAGAVVVIIRKDLLARSSDNLPDMFSYAKIEKQNSLLNTPPVFAIYIIGLVAKYLLGLGGLAGIEQRNKEKANLLYNAIDESGGFYKPHAQKNSRSLMNVTFRLGATELEEKFIAASKQADIEGIKGHRSVGGMRASIYNAVSLDSVKALVDFMSEFKKQNG
ncbi:MAG: 3-phosphoserine/phosphohydroxythreonine transaminase [Deltaproteobacteria bacterium]|nr:3-phosphoserine/phosphohydroxythreonine transaminase [Deltaproteobacteria bacterium]